MKIWRLKKGADFRIRSGHPWVFTGELAHSAKELAPGEVVELRDAGDHFLAYGYGHPSSQICFRKLSSRSKEKDVLSVEFFQRRLQSAFEHRRASGWSEFSHRWLFAEADGVPGLVVDSFLTAEQGWIVVVQASTAGMDKALPNVYAALEELGTQRGGLTVVDAPSSKSRVMEGLKIGEKRVVFGSSRDLYDSDIRFLDEVRLRVDIAHGQKTGFFLDQQWNIHLLKKALKHTFKRSSLGPGSGVIRILDVCCYVGQWSAHLAAAFMSEGGRPVHVTTVDTSEPALSFAKHNVSRYAGEVESICGDALEVLGGLEPESYDIVVCDPPAFIKKRADLENGLRAYTKLNRDALKLLKPGGIFVGASCSGLVKAEDWRQVLMNASLKSGRVLRHLYMGGHGPDHPVRPEFPEGEYLKCFIARADAPF